MAEQTNHTTSCRINDGKRLGKCTRNSTLLWEKIEEIQSLWFEFTYTPKSFKTGKRSW